MARLEDSGAQLAHACCGDIVSEASAGGGLGGEDGLGQRAARAAGGAARQDHGDQTMAPRPRPPWGEDAPPPLGRAPAGQGPARAAAAERGSAGARHLPMVEALSQCQARLHENLADLATKVGWDLRNYAPSRGQTEAIALMLTDLEGTGAPPPAPWVLAQMDAGLLLVTGLIRSGLAHMAHRQMSLHLSDEGFADRACGRWRWRPGQGWKHTPWTAAEQLAGGVRPRTAHLAAASQRSSRATAELCCPLSIALGALMSSCDQGMGGDLDDFELNICSSSRHLGALIQQGSLATPLAVFATGLEPAEEISPPAASVLRGFDEHGFFVLTSGLHASPTVLRSPEAMARMPPLARAMHAAAPEDCEAEILAGLCRHRPVGSLASLILDDTLADLEWLDLPALRLVDVHQSCGPHIPIYASRLGRGQRLNGAALAALGRQQLNKLLP